MIKSFTTLTVSLLLSSTAFADTYLTEFLGSAAGDFSVSRIEITWSTAAAFGNNVTQNDLSDLRFSAYDDNAVLIFTDNAIVEGAIQPIGGVPRDLDDIAFDAVSGMSIGGFDNDVLAAQQGSLGSTYNIYRWVNGSFRIDKFMDGMLDANSTFTLDYQNTSAIPEPSTYASLTGLIFLGLAVARRTRDLIKGT